MHLAAVEPRLLSSYSSNMYFKNKRNCRHLKCYESNSVILKFKLFRYYGLIEALAKRSCKKIQVETLGLLVIPFGQALRALALT